MQIRPRLEAVIEDMLDGHILLDEALEEFEKLYIQKAFTRNKKRITHTAAALGAHRKTSRDPQSKKQKSLARKKPGGSHFGNCTFHTCLDGTERKGLSKESES